MNTYVPALVGEHFTGSRIVVFSTILVYAYSDVKGQGLGEDAPPFAMPGEYANSSIGRERTFEYFSHRDGTPVRSLRLCYSIDMRYGVFHEVATKVFKDEPVDLTAGHVNVIWQGDANAQALRCLGHCTVPASPLNITGPEIVSIRALAKSIGRHMGKAPIFTGAETDRICLVNGDMAADLFGYPQVPVERMARWIAHWVADGGLSWNKPCHYDTLDGVF